MKDFTYIVKLHHVGMPDFLENSDFAVDSLQICVILDLVLFQNLDCDLNSLREQETYLFARRLVCSGLNFPKSALPFCLSYTFEN